MPSLSERLGNILRRKPKGEPAVPEKQTNLVDIELYDLREKEAAEEKGIDPGLYFAVTPISFSSAQDPLTLHNLSPAFFQALGDCGLLQERSEVRIPIDNKDSLHADPGQGWEFRPTHYLRDTQTLIVKASPADPDQMQEILVDVLRRPR